MGTKARIVLYAPDTTTAKRAAAAAFGRIAELDAALSDYRVDSEVSAVAAAAGGHAVHAGPDLIRILERALALSGETDGAFDVTAGPLTVLWRTARRSGAAPSPDSIRDALQLVDWRRVQVDTAAGTVRLATAGMRLDLGAIAKGYAADRAMEKLRLHGVERALVVLGGEIVTGGAPPGRNGWQIAVEFMTSGTKPLLLANTAVSSSGDTEQSLDENGLRYSHVIHPHKGSGLTDGMLATVIAPDGMTADAFATIVTLLDAEDRARFIDAHPEARFLVCEREANGLCREHMP